MRAHDEQEKAKKHNPAKALRNNPEATVVEASAPELSGFFEHKN